MQREIDGLRMKRKEVETSLEGIVSTVKNAITFVREQDQAHREEKVFLHRPRQSDAAAAPVTPLQQAPVRSQQG